MGDLIRLERLQARRQAGWRPPAAIVWFDLASPMTYLAAERVDRLFRSVELRPVIGAAAGLDVWSVAEAEARAEQLGVPLVWPESAGDARRAMRVASLAAERGRAAPYVLAATRLAFCGGFDLDDPEVLAEAAAAATLGLHSCMAAAADPSRDTAMEEEAVRLCELGADRLPAVRVGRSLFCGEERVVEAARAARSRFARRVES